MAGLAYIMSERVHPVSYRLGAFFASIGIAAALYLAASKISVSSIYLSAGLKFLIFLSFPLVLYLVGFFKKNEVEKVKQTVQMLWAARRWRAAALPE
jgi:1,4-dihydroxy-2-naphthoate octaprenyltransferase